MNGNQIEPMFLFDVTISMRVDVVAYDEETAKQSARQWVTQSLPRLTCVDVDHAVRIREVKRP